MNSGVGSRLRLLDSAVWLNLIIAFGDVEISSCQNKLYLNLATRRKWINYRSVQWYTMSQIYSLQLRVMRNLHRKISNHYSYESLIQRSMNLVPIYCIVHHIIAHNAPQILYTTCMQCFNTKGTQSTTWFWAF